MKGLVLMLCVGAMAACASSHRYAVHDPVERKFGAFQSVEVLPFSTNVQSEAANRVADELPDEIVSRLREATRKGSQDRLFAAVTRSTDEIEGVLTISGKILSFEEGSRAKRYLIGLGSGKAYATVQCTFTDKSTGQEIAVATFDGELSGGFLGGSSAGAAKGVIKALEDFLRDNY